ncbi:MULTISPECIES: hypothetical protein [Streptacidiphilus]|uniref:Alpha-1,2-mannosidase n=1 Tax=Streptacidiphilus cavernicola TaxID=3342716 RepID=A0ABV6UGV9_9ACTN|nr:hypothetical protein [Streptacidiphilus jeojiense]
MEPTFADFSVSPPLLGNGVVRNAGSSFGGDHLKLGAGGSAELDFEVAPGEQIIEATLKVTLLTSKLGPSPGFAPMDLVVNGEPLVEALTVPGGGDLPQTLAYAVPGEQLHPGTNTVAVRSSPKSATMLWLYRITVDSVYERDRSERAMGAKAAERAVFAFRTERRPVGAENWVPAPPLHLHVDRGEHALPSQVSWRSVDGAEGAAVFQSAMTDFLGHHRAADGTVAEFRGRLAERRAHPDGTSGAPVHRFSTQEGWGGGWHDSGELRLLVDHGGVPLERVSWRDQRTNGGSIALLPDGSGFVGIYQRVNEGPIGYRSVPVLSGPPLPEAPAPAPPAVTTAASGRAELQEELVRTAQQLGRVTDAAAGRLAKWLRDR